MHIANQNVGKKCCLFLAALSSSISLLAHTSPNVKEVVGAHNPYSDRKIYTNPFTSPSSTADAALSLTATDKLPFPDAVRAHLYGEKGLSPELEVISQSLTTTPTGRETGEFILAYQTIPLCEHFVKAHRIGSVLFVSGEIPDDDMQLPDSTVQWPSAASVAKWLQTTHPLATIDTQHAQSCWWVSRTQPMIPAYEFHLQESGQGARAIAGTHQLFTLEASSFSFDSPVMATIQSYTRDPVDGRLQEDQIEVTDPLVLSNNYFTIDNGNYPRASSADHMFVYSPDDDIPFTEANIFAALNRYQKWLQGIGYVWQGGQITVQLHQLVFGTPNNAMYMPAVMGQSTSSIKVGDGDGIVLGSLPKDNNVGEHELTHEVLWRALKSTQQYESESETVPASLLNHSLAIHEGLADSFPFLYEDDPCLAKSVCPLSSPICYVPGKCLRTAENSIQYKSDTYWGFGNAVHKKGQVVSGLVWDLRKAEFLPLQQYAAFMNHSIDYLLPKSTYQDLIFALLFTDYELYNAAYCSDIVSAAQSRGFNEEVNNIDCHNMASLSAAKIARDHELVTPPPAPAPASSDSGSKKKTPFCGIATSEPNRQDGSALVYLLPLLFFIGRRLRV